MNDFTKGMKYVVSSMLALWAGTDPIMQILLMLMALDIISGIFVAIVTCQLSSDSSFRGIAKKALILCLVTGLTLASRFVGTDIDVGSALAGAYIIHELISIVENCSRAGIPLPVWLLVTLKNANRLQATPGEIRQAVKEIRQNKAAEEPQKSSVEPGSLDEGAQAQGEIPSP